MDYRDNVVSRCDICWRKTSVTIGTFVRSIAIDIKTDCDNLCKLDNKTPVKLAAIFVGVTEASAFEWYECYQDMCDENDKLASVV